MLRNIARIVKIMVSYIAMIVSPYAYAGATQYPVEIKCHTNPIEASWCVLDGESGLQFTITTEGLRVDNKENIEEVVEVGSIRSTRSGVHMFVIARCVPSNNGADITLTGNSLACGVGEGIKIKMFGPNDVDSDKYHYVGVLTVTTPDEEKKHESIAVNATPNYDGEKEKSPPYIGLSVSRCRANFSSIAEELVLKGTHIKSLFAYPDIFVASH